MKQHAPATARNQDAIAETLHTRLPTSGTILEIASGSGQHAVHLARIFPHLEWQPSDVDPVALASIDAWRNESQLPNLRAAITLDVATPDWETHLANQPAAALNANMIHISPWPCCLGLFAGLGRALPIGAPMFLYGPFRFGAVFRAPSNAAFDDSLRARDGRWGVRDIEAVAAVAQRAGFDLTEQIPMPANNHLMAFVRTRVRS